MNTRRHLSLVPSSEGRLTPQGPSAALPRRARRGNRPAGGRAAAVTALAAGLTLGLMSGGASTLLTHPGDATMVVVPLVAALGLTIVAAFRSRAVAQRRRRQSARHSRHTPTHDRALRPRPVLVHSRDDFQLVVVTNQTVVQPIRRAA